MKQDRKLTECRMCGSRNIIETVRFADVPFGDNFHKDPTGAKTEELHELALVLCEDCGNVFLNILADIESIYERYIYRTSVSQGLGNHFAGMVADCMQKRKPDAEFVVEIGSNEGLVLEEFKRYGVRVLGIEPSPVACFAKERGILTLKEYFTSGLAKQIVGEHGKADFIIAANVLANIHDLDDIAEGCRTLLKDGGELIIESSYFMAVLQNNLIDTIYHEHLSYFTITAIGNFFRKHGMELHDYEINSSKGGSVRYFIKKGFPENGFNPKISNAILKEREDGLFDPQKHDMLNRNTEKMRRNLEFLLKDGRETVVYGASVGIVTMIYLLNLKDKIRFIVDDNPIKTGTFSPHAALEVKSPEIIREGGYRVIICAWRFIDSIAERQPFIKNARDIYVTDLPSAEIREWSGNV
ncbi:class I SAM-dependent methyltransferase [Seleniivibrio woodruffii]|uniref:Putative zinc binding protein n=1 Tax=Seleniivibrio woodruffii TaxID=1078050 RepID=A0A4R1KB30_9BACT|nr:class I SAM-dependent methyltransferase [Seleniivibrio woodruffii]TCK61665.1 putative zinc binding protein [Seleniivibrio woodruffii]TVZ35220.1 putative zinc binding protein [Seleniivibrio woodruffii]